MMRGRGIDRGAAVLRWRSWRRVVHIGGQLAHDVPWGRSNWRGSCRHGGRGGLVVHHVWCSRGLGRMLHGVADRGRWGGRRAKMLLWWCHHVVGVRHYGWLPRIVPRVVVSGLRWAWPTWVGFSRGRVILDGHSDEIAVFTSCYRGNAECLGAEGRGRDIVAAGWWRLTVGVVAAVLKGIREVNVVFG